MSLLGKRPLMGRYLI